MPNVEYRYFGHVCQFWTSAIRVLSPFTGGNPVLATLDAILAEVTDARMIRRMDEQFGVGIYTPESV